MCRVVQSPCPLRWESVQALVGVVRSISWRATSGVVCLQEEERGKGNTSVVRTHRVPHVDH
jgi:hypothetical protein